MNDDAKWCSSRSDDVHFRLLEKIGDKAMKICGAELSVVGVLGELGQQ